jgi:hypothetical protein
MPHVAIYVGPHSVGEAGCKILDNSNPCCWQAYGHSRQNTRMSKKATMGSTAVDDIELLRGWSVPTLCLLLVTRRDAKLPGDEAIMHDRLVIEPVRKRGLLALRKTMKPLDEGFPEIDDPVPAPEKRALTRYMLDTEARPCLPELRLPGAPLKYAIPSNKGPAKSGALGEIRTPDPRNRNP